MLLRVCLCHSIPTTTPLPVATYSPTHPPDILLPTGWLIDPDRVGPSRPGPAPGIAPRLQTSRTGSTPRPPGHGSDQSRYPTPATSTLRDRIMAGLAPRGCPGHGHSQSALVCASLSHRPSPRPARLGQGPPPGRRRARLGLGSTRTKRPILSGKIASAMGEGLTGVG